MLDLLVIGAGLSGMMAAATAAQAGLKVKVIGKGQGTLIFGAGTVDVLGYCPGDSAAVLEPLSAIAGLAVTDPRHPYTLLEDGELEAALHAFQTQAAAIGLPYSGAAGGTGNLNLPSPAGAVRPSFLAPQAQMAGDLSRDVPTAIVGLEGLRDFYPELIAGNLRKQGYNVRAASVPWTAVTERRDANTVHLAEALDDPGQRRRFARELHRAVYPDERVGLPAILGLRQHAAMLADLQEALGMPVFEIPTMPPSVPGLRLISALQQRLERLGCRTDLNMQVMGRQVEDGRVAWVETETSARPLRHSARNFLLATGGILGGGIDSDYRGRVWETALDLPLALPPAGSPWFSAHFLDPAGHPLFRSGVPVDRNFQPVDEAGRPVYANVWAAGTLLAHADPIQERSLEGLAIATGFAAARRIISATERGQ